MPTNNASRMWRIGQIWYVEEPTWHCYRPQTPRPMSILGSHRLGKTRQTGWRPKAGSFSSIGDLFKCHLPRIPCVRCQLAWHLHCFLSWDNSVLHDETCRKRHADVLELVLFLNVHSNIMYEVMFGDKDTFELAFMLSGKGSEFQQMPVWVRNALSHKYEVIHQTQLPAYPPLRTSDCPWLNL